MLTQVLSAIEGLGIDKSEALKILLSADDRLTKLKMLLGIADSSKDSLLEFVIQTIERMILNYINHTTLPPNLENCLLLMCTSYAKASALGTSQAAVGPISSVKRGDVTTSFATASGDSGSAQTFNVGGDGDGLFGWRTTLQNFRRLGW